MMKQTTLCYIFDGDSVLMLHRTKKKNDQSHDKWLGLGGKCLPDESPDECMVREVEEESGFVVSDWVYRGIVTFVSDVWESEYMHLFTASHWSGREIACNEGDLCWIAMDSLLDLPLWQGDKIFLKLLMDPSQPFFSLKLSYSGDFLVSAKLDGRELALKDWL